MELLSMLSFLDILIKLRQKSLNLFIILLIITYHQVRIAHLIILCSRRGHFEFHQVYAQQVNSNLY